MSVPNFPFILFPTCNHKFVFTSVTLIFVLEIRSFVPFVSHSLRGHTCPRACLTSGIFTTALSLSLNGYKAKAGKHWPSELGRAGRTICEHPPASWVTANETHSPQGRTRKGVKWKPKPGGMSLPISSFCVHSPAARTHWPAPGVLARFPLCVCVCGCVCRWGKQPSSIYEAPVTNVDPMPPKFSFHIERPSFSFSLVSP